MGVKKMAVKKLDAHIKKAFTDLGFTDAEIIEGCWDLTRNGKTVAWLATHKFLERVAGKAGITFNMPTVLNCVADEVAVCVEGVDKNGNTSWSIGEASSKNNKNEYRWAMAEKRAKDRVILKLLGIAGYMYSEEEADEFKETIAKAQLEADIEQFEADAVKEKTAKTKALNKAVAEGTEYVEAEPTQTLQERYDICMKVLENKMAIRKASVRDKVNKLLRDLQEAKEHEKYTTLQKLVFDIIGVGDDNANL
jgi:predicted RNA-binding protein with RPS1 domain